VYDGEYDGSAVHGRDRAQGGGVVGDGGRMQAEMAAELGVMPTMLRRWQRKLQESSAGPASLAAKRVHCVVG
jgi:hypothetical protein